MDKTQELRKMLLTETKEKLQESINEETILFQQYQTFEELTKTINKLEVKLRGWISCYIPEIKKIDTQEELVRIALIGDKEKILKELEVKDTVGSNTTEGFNEMVELAKMIQSIVSFKIKTEDNLEKLAEKIAPETCKIVKGKTVAQILTKVGGLAKLSKMPSTAIQLIGAEKALFRHLKNKKNRSPKYGLLSGVVDSKIPKEKAKQAKQIAAKISIASRRDYYGTN